MADSASLEPPHEVKPTDAEVNEQPHGMLSNPLQTGFNRSEFANAGPDDSSDSEDQFTDAQSAPMTPHLSSPRRKANNSKAAEEAQDDESQEVERESEADEVIENNLNTTVEQPVDHSHAMPKDEEEDTDTNDGLAVDEEGEGGNDDAGDDAADDDFGDDFGDDFDDFAEGEEADETFDDFDNSFAQPEPQPQPTSTPTPSAPQKPPPFVSCLVGWQNRLSFQANQLLVADTRFRWPKPR